MGAFFSTVVQGSRGWMFSGRPAILLLTPDFPIVHLLLGKKRVCLRVPCSPYSQYRK